jgi:hypothetical protein
MPTKELSHVVFSRHILISSPVNTGNTPVLDIINFESAAFLLDLSAGNLSASNTVALTLQESDSFSTGYAPVDPMYVEWFLDGMPGNVSGAAGAQVWTKSIPGYGGVLTLNTETGITAHTYQVSYVGGQHRYIRLAVATTGSPTNNLAVVGLLDSPRYTAGDTYHNYPVAADFPSITFPV